METQYAKEEIVNGVNVATLYNATTGEKEQITFSKELIIDSFGQYLIQGVLRPDGSCEIYLRPYHEEAIQRHEYEAKTDLQSVFDVMKTKRAELVKVV